MMVKICGITRRDDAVAAAEAGASAIGFIFYPKSPRYVTPEKARELGDGLEISKVGVFVDESPAFVDEVMQEAKLDVAQVYGRAARPKAGHLWLAVRVTPGMGAFAGPPREAVLLDSAANGVSFDWRVARFIGEHEKMILAGGLDEANVAEAIRIARPWGVDASSGLEISPGIKDHEKVRQFIKVAREAL